MENMIHLLLHSFQENAKPEEGRLRRIQHLTCHMKQDLKVKFPD